MFVLDDEELAAIFELALPLPCKKRSDFVELVASRIAGCLQQACGGE
jgi:hypothetical protein